MGVRFRKDFGRHRVFTGTVMGKEGKYYQVRYEDGDREDLSEEELGELVPLPPPKEGGRRKVRLPQAVTDVSAGRAKRKMVRKLEEMRTKRLVENQGSFVSSAMNRLTAGLAASTQSKYRTVMKHFKTFLIIENLDWNALGVLAGSGRGNVFLLSSQNEALVMGYAEYLVTDRRIQVSSARQYVTNLKTQLTEELRFDPSYECSWSLLRRLWSRLEVEYPDELRRRDTILQHHLLLIRGNFDLSKPVYKMYWAAILMLFFVVGRKSDHFPKTRRSFKPETDTTRSDVRYVNDDLLIVGIKQTKTRKQDKNHPGKPLIRDAGNPLCPVTALEDYLRHDPLAEGGDPNSCPLFMHGDGSAVCGDDIHKFVKQVTACIGLNANYFGGHSLRIGGATAALACDSGNKYTVKVLGMWVGESIQLYTRPTMEMLSVLLLEMMRKKKTDATSTL